MSWHLWIKQEELSKSTEFINYYNYEENHESEKMDFYNTGKNEGEHQRSIEIAKNMLDLDIDIDKIVKATGLSEEEVSNLQYWFFFSFKACLQIILIFLAFKF